MECIAFEPAFAVLARSTSLWLCSSFLPCTGPEGKCQPWAAYWSSYILVPPVLAIHAEAGMKQVRQSWRSVGGLLTAGKIKSKLREQLSLGKRAGAYKHSLQMLEKLLKHDA